MRKLPVLALVALLPLAACDRDEPAPAPADNAAAPAPAGDNALSRKIQEAMAEASRELATKNIDVGDESGRPKAKISPQGDLLIDGKPVPVDDAQRKLLLAHRANLVAVSQAGIAVGMQATDLGITAATGALRNLFGGKDDGFEKEMEARGNQIEAEARKICARLPALLESQQALAAALPAFQPYATMDQSDVDDCGKDGNYDVDFAGPSGHEGNAEHEAEAGHETDAAAEADAAAARAGQ